MVPFFLDLDCFVARLCLYHLAAETNRVRLGYEYASNGYESGLIATVPSSSCSVSCTFNGDSQTIVKAVVTDFGSK